MTTKNLIPRGSGEGGIGITGTSWGSGVFNTGFFDSVGIGTYSPTHHLHLLGDSQVKLKVESTSGNPEIQFTQPDINDNTTSSSWMVGQSANDFFITKHGLGAGHQFVISNSGDVGIGTMEPAHNLHISGSNPGAKLEGVQPRIWLKESDQAGLNTLIRLTNSKLQIDTVDEDDQFSHNRFTILNTNGHVGIGTNTPTNNLTLVGNFLSHKTDVDGGTRACLINAGGSADEPTLNIYNKQAGDSVKISSAGIEFSGILMAPDENERITFGESGIMVGQAEVRPDPDNPESIYFQAIPQVKDSEGNAVTVLTADKLGLGTTDVLESAEQDLQFKLLTDQQRFVVGTTGDYGLESGWYRFNDFKVKGATDIGAHPINPVDTRIYSDESSFVLFKTDTAGNRVAHLVGGDEAISPNNAIALGIAVKVDSSESPEDIEFVHTDGESYSVINGNSDSVGTNGLPIRQGFQNPSVGANPVPLLIDGGSF